MTKSNKKTKNNESGGGSSSTANYKNDRIFCTKSIVIIFNFLFIVSAIMIIGLGIWTLSSKYDYSILSSSILYESSTYLLIIAGCLIVFASIMGIIGAWVDSKRFITLFIFFCVTISFVEILAGVLAFTYRAQLNESLKDDLQKFILNDYGEKGHELKSQKLDDLQSDFKCCGATDFFDWQESKYVKKSNSTARLSYFNLVAESCCKSPSSFCAKRTHPSNINTKGCVPEFEKYISNHILLLGVVGLGSGMFHSVGILLAFLLIRRINKRNRYSSLKSTNET